MLAYPAIDPVAFHVFSWPVHWYGLMYLLGFLIAWGLLLWRARDPKRGFTSEQVSDFIFYSAIGVIIGGRLGYMIFYDWHVLFSNPLLIFQIWKGGMSFHGGLIGVICAMWFCAHKMHKKVFDILDFIAPAIPLGLGAGRIGNFINDELWGRVTTVPWGIVFPNGGPVVRHPSQLYEFFFEGIVLFLILWIYSRKIRPRYAVSGVFAVGYGIFRFGLEFFREPDAQIGYLYGGLSEGQLLSIPMILLGFYLLYLSRKQRKPT